MTGSTPVAIRRGRPLAPMQRGLWMSQRRHPASPVLNMVKLSRFGAPVDIDRLVAAFADVVAASGTLATRIVDDGSGPVVHDVDEPAVTDVVDLAADDAISWAQERLRTPIDVAVRPYDSVVLRHPDGTASWYLGLHHLVTDAASSALVFAQTAAAYHGVAPDVASYDAWVRRTTTDDSARTARARTHWADRRDAPRLGRLYRPVRREAPESHRVPVPGLVTPTDDYRLLTDELTWTVFLATATAVLVNRVTGADRFSIGLPVHNRTAADAKKVIGPVMEVFPVDVEVEAADTFSSLHRRLAKAVMTTMRHAVPATAPSGDYEVLVNVIPRVELGPFGDIPVDHHALDSGAVDAGQLLWVQLNAYGAEGAGLVLDINDAAADDDHRSRVAGHLEAVLAAMVDDPGRRVGAVDLLSAAERELLRAWESAVDFPDPTPGIVDTLTGALAGSTEVVIDDGDLELTGGELWARSLRLAHWLRDHGVATGSRVGIHMPRSIDTVTAVLGTLAAGASYVPLDPAQPRARIDRLVERAGCTLVLRELPDLGVDQAPVPSWPAPGPDDEAYLLFTSGSTGEPKGVPITHRGLAGYVRFAAESYVGDVPEVVAFFSALTFDLTVTSLFVPLVTGGRMVVIADDGGAGLAALAARTDITWAKATPSHLEVLLRLLPDDHRLRTLVVGGEAFGAALARRLRDRLPGVAIFNEYGPTEAVVGCMIHDVTGDEELAARPEVAIGRPAPGVTLRIVDDHLARVPIGGQGELLIAHEGLTSGYLDAEADRDAFVQIDGTRWYRSGDLVRLTDPETLVYLGRIDEQVKVGGIRLEPVEVEAALERHPDIEAAAVRLWSPSAAHANQHCSRCGLPSTVPGTTFTDGICNVCRAYDRIGPTVASWFGTRDDLAAWIPEARRRRTGDYDCLLLLSGGTHSTYALHHLVDLGFRPLAFTLDNGFLSEGALDNCRRTVADLGVDHEIVTTDAMIAIFRDSLERHSDVCHGCSKTIDTLAANRAAELGIPLIINGLSRGELFETRLMPQLVSGHGFDPDAIDRAVVEARKAHHRVDDAANRLLDTEIFRTDEVFDRVTHLDFYRYVDVEPADVLDFLARETRWVRPSDTGWSTNCLINEAGIHTHRIEQGYHNYAERHAWDVRLGHKGRDEALRELDDAPDIGSVATMLDRIGYEPAPREILVAWLEPVAGRQLPTPAELRTVLADVLPVHAIPSAFVAVDQLPLTTNGKLDTRALPPPRRAHRPGSSLHVVAESDTERTIVGIWEATLGVEPIGVDDDFFALGGDSLAAIQMVVAVGERLGVTVREEAAFLHTTPRSLAQAIAEGATTTPLDEPVPLELAPGASPPMSIGERSIVFDEQLQPGTSRYNVGRVYHVGGAVDAERFAEALRDVVALHQPLHWTHGSPRRQLGRFEAVDIEVRSSRIPVDAIETSFRTVHRTPFDIETGPVLRCVVQPLDDGSTAVLLVVHHVAADADGLERLWQQLDRRYQGFAVDEPAIDYASFTTWQAATVTEEARTYWQTVDGDAPAGMAGHVAETDAPDGFVKREASFTPAELQTATGTTAFGAVLGSLAAVLARRVDGDRVGVGVIASTRNHPAAVDLVGYFLNTLPVEIDCPPTRTLEAVVAEASATSAAAIANRTVPYAEIVAARREAGVRQPVTDVLLAYDHLHTGSLGTIPVRDHVMFNGTAVAQTATVFVEVRDHSVDLSMEFRGSAMTPAHAEGFLDDLDAMIRCSIDRPEMVLQGIDLPSDAGRELRGPDLPAPSTVRSAILANAATWSDRPAVVCGGRTTSWGELHGRAGHLAAALTNRGVGRGDRVVVCLDRSADLVAAMLAAHWIGAAYVPIDPEYPAERIRLISDLARATAALMRPGTGPFTHHDIVVDDVEAAQAPPVADIAADDIAYVIFTSGSTGTPRGVAVPHGPLAASTEARLLAYDRQPESFLVVSSPSFDSSVAGLYWTLVAGGTVVLPTSAEAHDPDALLALFESAAITHTLLVPTLYQAMLERGAGQLAWPAQVIVAGEACPARLVERHTALRPGSALANEYGPTECTVWASVHHCAAGDDPVPIGPPIAGTWFQVVDARQRPVPAGIAGELIIGGAGVVPGYADDEAATAERFGVDDRGRRYFRTGDRAAIADGTVYFLGRLDDQLNVGGMRAEPDEIERVLTAHPGVAAAVVTTAHPRSLAELVDAASPSELGVAMGRAATTDDPATALADALREFSDADVQLVAHLEASDPAAVDIGALRTLLQQRLPRPLHPQRFVVHEALPRSANGKIDRGAAARLAVPASDTVAAPTPATGSLAGTLAALFRDVLGVEVGPSDSFFDLGGHSLLALRLLDRIEELLGRRVTVTSLYGAPTPAALAATIGDVGELPGQYEYVVPVQAGGRLPPIIGVHVLGVNAEYYRPLATQLGPDQPVYGLGVASSLADASAPTDVERVAQLYADELDQLVPEGPLLLTAVSIGAAVTFELGQQLRRRGRDVAMIALFDAAGPDATQDREATRRRLRNHAEQLRASPARYLRDRALSLHLRATRSIERAEIAARTAIGASQPDRLRIRRFIEANIRAALDHEIRPWDGHLVVFKAQENPFGWLAAADESLGWGSVARGGLEIIEVPGGHTSMLAEPHVRALADRLAEVAARVSAAPRPVVPLDATDVEAMLVDGLRHGRLGRVVGELSGRPDRLTEGAHELVRAVDTALRSVAGQAGVEAVAITDALAAANVDAFVVPSAQRMEHASLLVRAEDPDAVIEALAGAGYRLQDPLSPGGWRAHRRLESSVTLIKLDDATTRVTITWDADRAGERPAPNALRPTRADLVSTPLPSYAWPLYWAIRPFRLVGDRLRGRRAGGNLGPYLGTPTGMVAAVLELAAPRRGDLVVDIGCGDGRVLVAAATEFGCRGRGIERDPALAAEARRRVAAAGLDDVIEIIEADAADADLGDADVVFAFLPAETVARILPDVLDGLRPGARFVSHEQVGSPWPVAPDVSRLVVADGVTVASVWHRR